jgi:tetratricopeptide (TPR) repeat protein
MLLKINNCERVDKQKEIAANFRSCFLPDLKGAQSIKFKNQFIINDSNFYDCVVNLDIINSQDYDVDSFLKKEIYFPMLKTVSQNNPLENKYIMTFILNVHNFINQYSEMYCLENNKDNYKKKIKELCEITITYIKNYGTDSVIVHTQFIKGCIINIISAYGNLLLNNKDFNQLKNLVKFIDDLSKSLKFSESTPSFELIYKIKGDFWLFNTLKDINASISFYDKSLKVMPNNHPRRPIILFNIGYCYFVIQDKRKAIDYLNRCINEFNNIEQNRSPFDFYHRANIMNQKVKIAKNMIALLNPGQ